MANEAEALYRAADDTKALERFERISAFDPGRQVRARLRIGNIHQRNARIGAAMDAYIAAADDPGADGKGASASLEEREARRKALLNLNALASQQAARSASELSRMGRPDAPLSGSTSLARARGPAGQAPRRDGSERASNTAGEEQGMPMMSVAARR